MYKKPFAIPFIAWILIGTIVPGIVIAFYGFTDRSGAFTVENVTSILAPEHAKALWMSLLLAFISSIICLVISLPLALILRNSKLSSKGFLVFIFILPMWMNFLLRTMAWQVLLERGGLINNFFENIGMPGLQIINTPVAVVLGMVYDYLPFMILPIYNSMIKIENAVIEAKNNYHNKMEQMLNSYYENLTYNHEHASLVGEENQIVKVLGKNFLDSMTSILLVDVRETIKQKHFIA